MSIKEKLKLLEEQAKKETDRSKKKEIIMKMRYYRDFLNEEYRLNEKRRRRNGN